MIKSSYYCMAILSILLIACKHSHEPSASLKKAFSIQEEALKEIIEIDQMLPRLSDSLSLPLSNKKEFWIKNMIEIEGMKHDHSTCDGNHTKIEHPVSDEEMILVQQEWKDSIVYLKNEIINALNQ